VWHVQVEQFHTVVKGLATGPRNILASIKNQYLRLTSSNFTRLSIEIDWAVKPRKSTAASFLTRAQSADKKDLFVESRGKPKAAILSAGDLCQLQEVWGRHDPDYGLFLARFAANQKRLGRNQRYPSIAAWPSPRTNPFSDAEKAWQLMDGNIQVHRPPLLSRVHASSSYTLNSMPT
jgi:hypothetical protein